MAPRWLLGPALLMIVVGFFALGYVMLALLALPEWMFGLVGFVYACAAALGMSRVWGVSPTSAPAFDREKAEAAAAEIRARFEIAKQARIAELEGTPHAAKYIPMVAAGRVISNEEIAYLEDPDATVSCEHLQPVERAMRRAGLHVHLLSPEHRTVSAECVIVESRLRERFALPACVQYRLVPPHRDDAYGELRCTACQSTIYAAADIGDRSPEFPAG